MRTRSRVRPTQSRRFSSVRAPRPLRRFRRAVASEEEIEGIRQQAFEASSECVDDLADAVERMHVILRNLGLKPEYFATLSKGVFEGDQDYLDKFLDATLSPTKLAGCVKLADELSELFAAAAEEAKEANRLVQHADKLEEELEAGGSMEEATEYEQQYFGR